MKINLLLFLIGFVSLALVPYALTYSFFNDVSISTANTFSASLFTNHIVISEVQVTGATANQDFIELYNPTSQAVNLSNWRIRKKSSLGTITTLAAISNGKSIPAHGFFLWSNTQNGYDTNLQADISNTNTLSDNNSIELQDLNGSVVDQVAWGSGANQFIEGSIFVTNPAASQSIERKAKASSTVSSMVIGGEDEFAGNGLDTNNNSTDFFIRPQSQPQNSQSSQE